MSRAAALALAALALGAPAVRAQSTASTTTRAASAPLLYNGPGTAQYANLDTIGAEVVVPVDRAQAFHALRAVYADLQVPLTVEDSAAGFLGTLQLVRTQTIGRMRLSRALDCGSEMTGPVADEARIQLALVTFVRASGTEATAVHTALVASSQSIGGAQRDRVQCSTTGYLEDWIHQRMRERVPRP